MAKQSAFLQRRGDAFSFRIAVPPDLRNHIGRLELTQALKTTDKHRAVPAALLLASSAKRMFFDLRAAMSENNQEKLLLLIKHARERYGLVETVEEQRNEIAELRIRCVFRGS